MPAVAFVKVRAIWVRVYDAPFLAQDLTQTPLPKQSPEQVLLLLSQVPNNS